MSFWNFLDHRGIESMSLTLRLNEAGNVALTLMLLFGMLYVGRFIFLRWVDGEDIWHNYTMKAAIGLFTIFTGFMLKSAASWWALHIMVNTGHPVNSVPVSIMFVAGTGIALWGVVCKLRAISPGDWGQWTWLALFAAVIAFGALVVL